jgi:hypothetical protein
VTEFFILSRDGNNAFNPQRCSNRFGRFLEVEEFGSGSWRGLIEILKGQQGGWSSLFAELRKVASFFSLPIGKESRILPSRGHASLLVVQS